MTPGASSNEWSSPSSADVWVMAQVMPSAGPVEIAVAARRRYQLNKATARSIRRRAATLLYGRRATMAEVRSPLPVTGLGHVRCLTSTGLQQNVSRRKEKLKCGWLANYMTRVAFYRSMKCIARLTQSMQGK